MKSMMAHRAAARVEPDGTVTVKDQPFPPGTEVEVIVLPRPQPLQGEYPLRGASYRFDDPYSPIAADEWESAGVG